MKNNFLRLLALLLPLLLVSTESQAQQPLPAFEPTACMFEVPFVDFMDPEQLGFECGYVTVPLRHAEPEGPTIRLPVAIRRATVEFPAPDPLFLAQGGPGGDAFGVFSLVLSDLPLAQERDMVIFNQRGTLYAEPSLVCTESLAAMGELLSLPLDESRSRSLALYEDCRARLADEGIDLSAFNSLENAADVDAIRQALGYEEINFYGVSYGTLLALHLMRNFPDNLRSVILDSVVPTQLNFIPLVPQGKERVFQEMFRACAVDDFCAEAYPELESRFAALIDRLNAQPVTIPITDPETGETVEMLVDGSTFIDMLFQAFYLPGMYAVFPKLVVDMEAGQYGFWQSIWPLVVFDRTFSEGMYFSVICAEDSDFDPAEAPLEGVRPQIAATAREELQDQLDACDLWQVAQLPPSVDDPVESDVPTLVLAGQFDPITPPAFAAEAARFLTNSYYEVDPIASHGVAFNDSCVNWIVQDFLNDPTTAPEAGCLQSREPAEFVGPAAVHVPLLGQINQLDAASLIFTGLAGVLLAVVLSAWVVWPLALVVNLLRRQSDVAPLTHKLLGWGSKAAAVLFGLLAIIFVGGVTAALVSALGSNGLLLLSAVPGSAAPLFVIPWLLALLALLLVVAAILLWVTGRWSVWGRLYYSLVALSAVGYVIMLAATGMMSVVG